MKRHVIIAALSAIAFAAPAVVATVQPAAADPVIFAQMMVAPNPHLLQGIVTHFSGYNLGLHIAGRHVHVKLHPGTIIHPTGLTLSPGMSVRVHGAWVGGVFLADRISLVH
jgi:hypothetical protein